MISQFLYRNPLVLVLVIGVIVAVGISSLVVLPRLEDPVLGKRVGVISVVFPGADARRVESLVTIKLEEGLRGISEIRQMRSNSRTGICSVVVELRGEVSDVNSVWSLVRHELEVVAGGLPDGCLAPELDVLPLKAFAAIVAVKPRDETTQSFMSARRLARQLRTELSNLTGTESIQVFGDPGEEIAIDVDLDAVISHNLSAAAIARQIAAHHVTQPVGYLRNAQRRLLLDLDAPADPIEDLEQTLIGSGGSAGGRSLSEIASIQRAIAEPALNWAIVDGRRSIVLGTMVDDELRVGQWTERLNNALTAFQQQHAGEVELDVIFSQNDYIEPRLTSLLRNLLLGTAAVVTVVFLLMGWRSMLVVGMTLPLSALMVLGGMRAMQIPIHQMSVTGLIVALGLLIDNAIVLVEDLRARILAGSAPADAILESISHLKMPLFGSTLTTALAFLPIATLPGPPGEFVGTLAVTVILAISASFLLAMSVVPALLGLSRIDPRGRGWGSYGFRSGLMRRIYAFSLDVAFRFPLAAVLLAAALPVFGFRVAAELPEQFFPPSDRNQIQVEVELPASETTSATRAVVEAIQQTMSADEEIERVHWFIGGSAPTFYYNVVPRRRNAGHYAQAMVELRAGAEPRHVVRSVQQRLDENHAECRAIVRQLEQGPPFDAPIEIRVAGPDVNTLRELGGQLRLLLSQTPNIVHTRSDIDETIPKLLVQVESQESFRAGLSEAEIARQLYTSLEGASAGTIVLGDEELPVRVRLAGRGRLRMDQLRALPIQSARPSPAVPPSVVGGPAARNPPLAAIAQLTLGAEAASILRIDGKRTNEVKAYIQAGVLPAKVLDQFKQRLADSDFDLPPGYALSFGGERSERTSAVTGLVANAVVLFALIALTLVLSFRSFRYAAIIAAVGGLAIGLGPLALWLYGFPFGFMAIVGTMGLVGVAINDAIVVLAAIRENAEAAAGNRHELRNVVIASTRHVIATTLTTIVGFLPLILDGGRFWPPLAITVAGGVGGATLLALYFVPAMTLLLRGRRIPQERLA